MNQQTEYVIGLDEVGRGSLAGPVTVAALAIPKYLVVRNSYLGKLKDSKKLSHFKREEWFHYLKDHPQISFAVAHVQPQVVDKLNISKAANLAALRAYKKLSSRLMIRDSYPAVYLDGGLYLGSKKTAINSRTIIRGDEKIPAIALASIVAKVRRDSLMIRKGGDYPRYKFEIHKGYGTKNHRQVLRRYGPCDLHRRSFIKNFI